MRSFWGQSESQTSSSDPSSHSAQDGGEQGEEEQADGFPSASVAAAAFYPLHGTSQEPEPQPPPAPPQNTLPPRPPWLSSVEPRSPVQPSAASQPVPEQPFHSCDDLGTPRRKRPAKEGDSESRPSTPEERSQAEDRMRREAYSRPLTREEVEENPRQALRFIDTLRSEASTHRRERASF